MVDQLSPGMLIRMAWVAIAAFIAKELTSVAQTGNFITGYEVGFLTSVAQTGNFITGYKVGRDPTEFFLKWALLFVVGEVFLHTDILRRYIHEKVGNLVTLVGEIFLAIIGHPLESLSLYLFLGLFLPVRHTNTTYVFASRYDVPACILVCMLYRNYRRRAA